MQVSVIVFIYFVLMLEGLLMMGCSSGSRDKNNSTGIQDRGATTLVFEGTVLNLAPNPQAESGTFLTVYQLAKYRVDHVCKGFYEEKEIIVDHLILSTKELEGVKVGDQVCVRVEKSDRVFNRWDYPGIRKESDEVKVFNIGGKVKFNNGQDCSCLDGQ